MTKTPLYHEHVRCGGKIVDFFGFQLPVQYEGVIKEHMAVRESAGIFDVSHMGEVEVRGPDAMNFIQKITCSDVTRIKNGRAQYTAMLTEEGTFVDDLLVYKLEDDHFMMVINASNIRRDFELIQNNQVGDVRLGNISNDTAQIAIQGPCAQTILQNITPIDLDTIRYYRFQKGSVLTHNCLVSRTGYTGEDGFEIYCSPDVAGPIWQSLLENGKSSGLIPCGLACRDTLRLEAGMMLYGNDIDDGHTPFEAGLDWIVKLESGPFIGSEALLKQKQDGITTRLIGFQIIDRGIARKGCDVVHDGRNVGIVTSGTMLPYLKKAMGLAYVPVELSETGTDLTIRVRDKLIPAVTVEVPFYRREK